MKTKEEIEQLAAREYWNSNTESRSFIKDYTQCQEDMAKETNNKCYHPLPYRLAKSDTNFECTLCGKFI
jgi:hypothetical protein